MQIFASILAAAPTLEEVFKSTQQNVEGDVDGTVLLWILLGVAVFIAVLALVNKRQRKSVEPPKALNHQGKLTREVLKAIPLKAKEWKQLKIVAERVEGETPLASPLTLLLCPSVMAKTIQTKRLKVDRRALISVARKAGLQVTKK